MGMLSNAAGMVANAVNQSRGTEPAPTSMQQTAPQLPSYSMQPLTPGATVPGQPATDSTGQQSSINMRLNAAAPGVISALRRMSPQGPAQQMQFRTLGNSARPAYTAPTMRPTATNAPTQPGSFSTFGGQSNQILSVPSTYKGATAPQPIPQARTMGQHVNVAPAKQVAGPEFSRLANAQPLQRASLSLVEF